MDSNLGTFNPNFITTCKKPPRSRISDLLPSNIIDEIEVSSTPKSSLSFNNLSFENNSLNNNKSTKQSSDSATSDLQPQAASHVPKRHRKMFSSSKALMYSKLSQMNLDYFGNNNNVNQFPSFNNNLMYNDFTGNQINMTSGNDMGYRKPIVPRRMGYSDQYVIPNMMNRPFFDGMNINPLNYYNPNQQRNYMSNLQNNYSYGNNLNYNNNRQSTNQISHKLQPLNESQVEALITQIQYQFGQQIQGNQIIMIQLSALLDKIDHNLFVQLIKTSKGSRFLQKILASSPPSQNDLDVILDIITKNLEDVVCDYYGNYFLQKLLPYFSYKHRILLYTHIKPIFIPIANDICGNHSLQSLIMLQNSKEEENIIKECIEKDLQTLAVGANSSHVVQKVIKAIKEPNRDYINTFIISNLIDLCFDSHGICIVKEFIDNTQTDFYIKAVVSIFELETSKLTYDQYGNFGIQEIIKIYGYDACRKIISKICEHVVDFSVFKFSSNVVDFVIDYLSKNKKEKFVYVINKIFCEENNLSEMLKSKYATYVIENSLSLLDNSKDEELIDVKMKVISALNEIPNIKEKKKIFKIMRNLIEQNKMNMIFRNKAMNNNCN